MCVPALLNAMNGQTLAQQVYDRDDGRDSYATVRMLLLDKRGNKRFRTLISATKEYGNTEKSFIRFTSPADIEGTSFLTWENEDRENDQFLYLPALNRVRRIVSTQKSSRFVNTDYTYEDMERRRPDMNTHTILREEVKNGHGCWVLESVPKDPKTSQYAKIISWIAKEQLLPVRTEYYNIRGKLLKEFTASKIEQVDGIWAITESEMYDLKKKHHTYMKTLEIAFNKDIPDRVFTQAYMMHGE
jgi:outer membrane lipoprotein-sorting protein